MNQVSTCQSLLAGARLLRMISIYLLGKEWPASLSIKSMASSELNVTER